MSERRLCECGCGELIPAWRGRKPRRFAPNHQRRKSPVEYIIDEAGCWLWQKALVPDGYGSKAVGPGRADRAHRIYYEREFGPVPDGKELHHLCGVRRCVNPNHLEPITRREHTRLRSDNKLSLDTAQEIRASTLASKVLAKQYGVSPSLVNQVRRGEIWRP